MTRAPKITTERGTGAETARYKIVRVSIAKGRQVLRHNLTLEEALAHCRVATTRGYGWVDQYQQEQS